MFLNLEGLHGVGKSTVLEKIKERYKRFTLVPTIPEYMQEARREYDATTTSIDGRYLFYLSAIFASADQIRCTLDAGIWVATESFYHRTVAFHVGMGSKLKIDTSELIQPTLTVLLTCKEGIRKKRISERKKTTSRWYELAEKHAHQISEVYRRFNLEEVDVTYDPPDVIADMIVKKLGL